MKKILLFASLLFIAAIGITAGAQTRGGRAAGNGAAPATASRPAADMNQLMKAMMFPHSNVIFAAQGDDHRTVRFEECHELVALAEGRRNSEVAVGHGLEVHLHLVDGARDAVRDDDPAEADQDDEQREPPEEGCEHDFSLGDEPFGLKLEIGCLLLQFLLLFLEKLVLLRSVRLERFE